MAPFDRRLPPIPIGTPLHVKDVDIPSSLKSFAPGASGGIDGLCCQHLLELLGSSSKSGALLGVLSELVNLDLAGGVPETIRLYLWRVNFLHC